MNTSFNIRPLAASDELRHYYQLAGTAFAPHPSAENAQRWHQIVTRSPEFRPEQIRGAFRAGTGQLLGGYTVHERVLRMGEARISTGCIGAVVTDPSARKQGVASALLLDAHAFAQANNHPLLLLDGIPNFYFRYGYTDVFDVTAIEIDRSAVLAQAPVERVVREATSDDAAAMLDLYYRHFGSFTGSFERSLEVHSYRLRHMQTPPFVTLSARGEVEGYLLLRLDEEITYGYEVAADTWEALLALLQYHAHLLEHDPTLQTLLYFLPFSSPMVHWMIDTLEVPDASRWDSPAQGWGVRSLRYHHRFTGWMACLVDFHAVMHALLPELQSRWRRSLARWSGEMSLRIEDQVCTLQLVDTEVQLATSSTPSRYQLRLTPQQFLQGIFGYRPFLHVPDIASFSDDARAALAILFPPDHTWLPRSDWF